MTKTYQNRKFKSHDISLAAYIFNNIKTELEKLNNGAYFITITNVVINAAGKIVYFENKGVFKIGGGIDEQIKQKQQINNKIAKLMDKTVSFEPATQNGKMVAYLISNTFGYRNGENITVINHKAEWKSIDEQ